MKTKLPPLLSDLLAALAMVGLTLLSGAALAQIGWLNPADHEQISAAPAPDQPKPESSIQP
ncbi:hypothetical protein HNQ51_002140 [Inhella inkyongensis]|uniref:Uncharacterized protein n=1 Tax=Inhella inkyongensis TaxID=392593 RepID=A0A840S747_9BURK|nr:hypothetical protein [Inhella inkyongensis]MBB5204826.1 hypothetical protein [Inhella inkyongensis]